MAESSKHKKQPQEAQIIAKSRIDSKAELIEPIDFSFKDMLVIAELNTAGPRFPATQGEPKKLDDKYISLGLKLGYNALTEIEGLYEWCTQKFAYPKQLSLLDLSFNCINNISQELVQFEGLKTLYLHGNKITDVSEVDKLVKLKNLTALTLHGNPIETVNGARHYILAKLPNLRHLNFTGISKADRQTAIVWTKSNHKPLKAVIEGENKQTKKRGSIQED